MNDLYERGLALLKEMDGTAGEQVVEMLDTLCPDLGRYIVEFGFGEIFSRPGLDLRSREIATVAALTALGTGRPQLKIHVQAALNVGLSRDEIREVILHVAMYAGFPAAINGMVAAGEVFAETGEGTAA